jgi:hypothetical protein
MNSPIPTPYDIIPPPPGPITPPLTVWALLVGLTILAGLLLRYVSRRAQAQSMPKLLGTLTRELSNAGTHSESRASLERVARLSRRIVAPYLSRDATSLSASELRLLASATSNSHTDQDRALSEALSLVADLEDSLYAPATNPTDSEKQRILVQQLISRLESFTRSHRPS